MKPRLRLWFIVAIAIFSISIFRGIRYPNLWSYSHYLFNYNYGFVKRALLGEVITHLPPVFSSYYAFFIISLIIFLANVILLGSIFKNIIALDETALLGATLIYLSSMAVVYFAHTIGYFDHIGLLILLLSLKIKTFSRKMLFLLPAFVIALLLHEAIFIIFFPVVFISLLLTAITEGNTAGHYVLLAIFTVIVSIETFFLSSATIAVHSAVEMRHSLEALIGHPLRKTAFYVLFRNPQENWILLKTYWSRERTAFSLASSALVFVPSLLIIHYPLFHMLKNAIRKQWFLGLAILAPLSPILLFGMGWDIQRWFALSLTLSFVMLAIVSSSPLATTTIPIRSSMTAIFVFMLFLNGASRVTLFDEYDVKQFPFPEHVEYILKVLSEKRLLFEWPRF